MSVSFVPEITIQSPGRVNLLGEHVDYNDGLVLPAAIDRSILIQARRFSSGRIKLTAHDLHEKIEMSLESLERKEDINGYSLPGWALYPAGVASVLNRNGNKIGGIEVEFTSTLPIGAGLSSSAAVEVGFAILWQNLGGWSMDRMTLARLCQRAEVEYVGVNCGLMDQFACANGMEGHALLLDTRSLEWRPVKLPPKTCIVIADSKVRRKLISSEYNTRRAECVEAVKVFHKHYPSIHSLRDATMGQLQNLQDEMSVNIYKRAFYVINECRRVNEAVALLDKGDAEGFGKLMFQTHASLRDDYEVSIPELDALVEIASQSAGCLGARLTGAGFGGCTVNLVREESANQFIAQLIEKYQDQTGLAADVFRCQASAGTRVMI